MKVLLLIILGLGLELTTIPSTSRAATAENPSIEHLLADNFASYARLADPLDPDLAQRALATRDMVLANGTRGGIAPYLDSDSLQELKDAARRLQQILTRIEEQRGAVSETARTYAKESDDSEWPVADCSVISESSIGWSQYLDYVEATNRAAELWKAGQTGCKRIEILPISILEPFLLDSNISCSIELEECVMEVEGYFLGEGIVAAGGAGGSAVLTPGTMVTCTGLSTAVAVAQKAQSLMKSYLGCWDQAKAIANNGRLTVVRAEVQKLQGKIDILKRLVVEGSLNVRGGTRMSALYLPESQGGALEVVRDYTKTAFTQTAAAGYRMKPDIQPMLDSADAALEAGDYKRAFNLYRGAYRHITVKSREGLR